MTNASFSTIGAAMVSPLLVLTCARTAGMPLLSKMSDPPLPARL